MHVKRFITKKVAAIGLVVGVAVGGGGAAFAYFTSPGSGVGAAATAAASSLTISQVGPGYDSLATSYHQDQCFGCWGAPGGLTEFGNEINLATTGQLSDAIVAFRNWGSAVTGLPITLTLYSPGATAGQVGGEIGVANVTKTINVPASSGGNPTTFDVTFDFHSQDLTLSGPVVYGIAFDYSAAPSLNVALSSSAQNLTVGSDVYPGYVFVDGHTTNALSANGNAGSCATSTADVFMATNVWCSTPPDNYGAYGSAQGADIPAVEFNVVGGSPVLYPGEPAQNIEYAITNPGKTSVYVSNVTATLPTKNNDTENPNGNENIGCEGAWYALNNTPQTVNKEIPSGVTFFGASDQQSLPGGNVMSIEMPANASQNQDACEGTTLGLTFSSN